MFLETLFFKFLLLTIPIQLSKFYFPKEVLVYGARVDYLSISIYFTDLVIFLILFLWFKRTRPWHSHINNKTSCLLLLFLTVNLLFSGNKFIAILKILKLVEFILLGIYIYKNNFNLKNISKYILIGSILPSLLAIFQFIKQGSVGGLWWYLGERTFNLQTPNIAKTIIFGKLMLRPYATFPHPNVLAAYISLLLIITLHSLYIKKRFIYQFLFILLLVILFLTLSRTAIIVSLISLGVFIVSNFKKNNILPRQIFVIFIIILIFLPNILGRFAGLFTNYDDTIYVRKELYKSSLGIILVNPILGVGFNNFLLELPNYSLYLKKNGILQPVHNVFMLILSEGGIIGLVIFCIFIYRIFRKIRIQPKQEKKYHYLLFSQIIIFLLFDHFFYTLQQGELLFTILISSIILNNEQKTNLTA